MIVIKQLFEKVLVFVFVVIVVNVERDLVPIVGFLLDVCFWNDVDVLVERSIVERVLNVEVVIERSIVERVLVLDDTSVGFLLDVCFWNDVSV